MRRILLDLESRTVVNPPRPCAPIPRLFASKISSRSSSVLDSGPYFQFVNINRIHQRFFAITAAFSGYRRYQYKHTGDTTSPIVGIVCTTQSTIESDGLSITNLDLFSDPRLGRKLDINRFSFNELVVNNSWCIIFSIYEHHQDPRESMPKLLSGCVYARRTLPINHIRDRHGRALPETPIPNLMNTVTIPVS